MTSQLGEGDVLPADDVEAGVGGLMSCTHLLDGLAQRIVDGNHPGHEQLVDYNQIAVQPAKHLTRPRNGALGEKKSISCKNSHTIL